MSPRLDAFAIVVRDMGRSLAFYRHLGLEFAAGAEAEPHAEAVLPGGLRLMLDREEMTRSINPAWTPPAPGTDGRAALAFLCDSPDDVDAVYASLTEAGHQGVKEPWDAFWGQRYAMVQDPDGNAVDLFAPLPPSG